MIPTTNLNTIYEKVCQKYENTTVVTIGILVADARQDEAKQYVFNYMNHFDSKAGEYFDLYIPGYYEVDGKNVHDISKKYHPNSTVKKRPRDEDACFSLERTKQDYYFDANLFDDFIAQMEYAMNIRYTFNPMLLLVEVNMGKYRGEIEFQSKLVIELDDATEHGVRRAGMLLDRVFEIAKADTALGAYQRGVKMYFIKGKRVHRIAKVLEGDWIEVAGDVGEEVYRYRIKR